MSHFSKNYKPKTRVKTRAARRTRFWCFHCDAQYVAEGERCLNCGKIDRGHRKRRLKRFDVDRGGDV